MPQITQVTTRVENQIVESEQKVLTIPATTKLESPGTRICICTGFNK